MRLAMLAMLAASGLAGCAPSLPAVGGDPASPLQGDGNFGLVEPRPWRETNDRVRDLDGPDAHMLGDSEDDPIPGRATAHDRHH
jgi:hypothetical protein